MTDMISKRKDVKHGDKRQPATYDWIYLLAVFLFTAEYSNCFISQLWLMVAR